MKLKEAVNAITENLDEDTRKLFLDYVGALVRGEETSDDFLDPLDRDYLALQNDINKIELRNKSVRAFAKIAEEALTKALISTL